MIIKNILIQLELMLNKFAIDNIYFLKYQSSLFKNIKLLIHELHV